MAMKILDYQEKLFEKLRCWLELLAAQKARAVKLSCLVFEAPDLTDLAEVDFTEKAWEELRKKDALPDSRSSLPFTSHKDGLGRPVPNAVIKIPTGGGKTYVATRSIGEIFRIFLRQQTGFILWIVPNEAIYTQTIKRLADRDDPYRQVLDRLFSNRVKILEKSSSLSARDVQENLCIMVLMLQSANRQTKETLKMFQDRGDVHGFFPDEGDQQAQGSLKAAIPNLDVYEGNLLGGGFPQIKDSLGNVLRKIRPVVILDEGHKATSESALETLYGFNPSFVLEFTATPKDLAKKKGRRPVTSRYANILVEVRGVELDKEGMIKMPLNLDPRQGSDWRVTLNASLEYLNRLRRKAETYRANGGNYIRPIMLVQVERTGADQRESGCIHAEDVREWLLAQGLSDAEIAIKTSQKNDLKEPENQDLLSPSNRVRVIITKAALQEGWDCPFAYVLCALAASRNTGGMTQLVGRILRQPYAQKTGISDLDESWVITHHAETSQMVKKIRDGLQSEGLGDLTIEVVGANSDSVKGSSTVLRREKFRKMEVYLPKVLFLEEGKLRDINYEDDILAGMDWRGFEPRFMQDAWFSLNNLEDEEKRRITLSRDEKASDEALFESQKAGASEEVRDFCEVHVVRSVADLIPNPFVAMEVVEKAVESLAAKGIDREKLGMRSSEFEASLRRELESERDRKAEKIFCQGLEIGKIQFRLRLDKVLDWEIPERETLFISEDSPQMRDIERSLFQPVYKEGLNKTEQEVAVFLDGQSVIQWWHRNVARTQYGLAGWKRHKIYPDFLFLSEKRDGKTESIKRIVLLETKGSHLAGSEDSVYKKKLMNVLNKAYRFEGLNRIGQIQWGIERHSGQKATSSPMVIVQGALEELEDDWKSRIRQLI